jgi:predicted dehydrogenase
MFSSVKLLLGVIGCGRVFERYYLPALATSNDWRLSAVCEPLKERREWIGRFYQEVPAFAAYQEFLKYPSMEAVLITTPPATHFSLSAGALDAGLHVMVEKPFALNVEDARNLFEASQRKQRKLQIGFNRRFNPYYLELKKKLSLIPQDHIKFIFSKLIINPDNWNAVTSFYRKDSEGGGVIDDVASHQIDLMPWLLADKVESVRASLAASDSAPRSEHIKFELKFTKGLIATCEAGHGTKYIENLEIQLENRSVLAYPTGLLEVHRIPSGVANIFSRLRTFLHFSTRKFSGKPNVTLKSIERQLISFADAVRGEPGEFKGADAQNGIVSLQIIDACRKSIQSGGTWIAVNL